MTQRIKAALCLAALLVVTAPASADAQVRRGRAVEEGPGWVPISLGAQFGYDQNARGGGTVWGAGAQIPVLPNGYVKLLPSVQATLVRDGREYQYSLEAVFVTGGRQGGLYAGGGFGKRTSTLEFVPGVDDVSTLSLVAGVTTGFAGRLQTILEFRWIRMDDITVRPTPVTIGLSIPLWGAAPPGS